MLSNCPNCGYDLAGIRQGRGEVCPECGAATDETAVVAERWRSYTRWSVLFFLAPILALPAVFFSVFAQPILCLALSAWFGYHALNRSDDVDGVAWKRFGNTFGALTLALCWTMLSSMLLGCVGGLLFASPL